MKTQLKKLGAAVFVLLMAVSFLFSGCATSSQVKELQAQVNMAMQKADDAMAAAEAAKAAVADTSANCDKAAQDAGESADRAEAAAARAVDAAGKAEALFMKQMKK